MSRQSANLIRLLAFLFLVGPMGCSTDYTTQASYCQVSIESLNPSIVEAGGVVRVAGHPLTTHFDTAAFFDNSRAVVLDVDRSTCEACDSCRVDEDCNLCEDCDACDAICDETCTETITIQVPEIQPGSVNLQIFNSYGQSNTTEVNVVRPPTEDNEQPLDTSVFDDVDTGHTHIDTAHDPGSSTDTGVESEDSGVVSSSSDET